MNYSIEAEQAVVGGLLVDPEKLAEVLELITYQDFYSVRCRHIFYAIHTLAAANYEIDALTVAESLTASGTIDEAGGYPFVVQLASDVSSTANLVQYAKLIGEKSLQRQLIKSCAEIVKATESGAHSTQELLAFASSQLEGLQGGLHGEPVETFRQLLKSRVMALDDRKNGGAVKGLLTGFTALDERFNGIDPGALWILAARPGMGKTTLALNLADKISRDGGEVLIFSMEMPKEQLVDKMICGSAKFSYAKFRAADIGEDEWNKVEAGVGLLIKKNIHIIDRAGMEISHAASIAKKYAKHGNLKLIIVDYLQLFKCKSASRFEEVSEVSRQLKIMAKNCNCVVLALSQLNRNCESRSDKRPNNSDLRESGQIEQDADIISFIYREDYYFPETNNKGVAEIITTKWRHGDSGTDGLSSMLHESRFADLDFKYVRQQNAENKTTSRGYN